MTKQRYHHNQPESRTKKQFKELYKKEAPITYAVLTKEYPHNVVKDEEGQWEWSDKNVNRGGFNKIENQEMFVDEKKEHPSFTNSQVRQIVKDHLAKKHGEKAVEEAEEEDNL